MASKMFSALEAADIKEKLREKIPKTLNLLITGKTGVGKSHLVNVLVGQEVAKEGEELDPCTSKVASYEADIEGVKVTVWDSPGLQDGTTKEAEYIQDMKTKVKDVALMIYCIKMDDTRFQEADKKAIRILTDEFGEEVWNHAVLALTFANKVKDHKKKEDKLAYFQKKLNMWEKHLVEYFSPITQVRIPVIPAGIGGKMGLPDRENWLSDVWVECYQVTKASARLGLYKINRKRVQKAPATTPERDSSSYAAQATPASTRIPSVIPLNKKQEKSFVEATLKVITDVVLFPVRVVAGVVGGVLNFLGSIF